MSGYKMMKIKEVDTITENTITDNTITYDLYKLLKEYFCFDFIKNNIKSYEAYLIEEENKKKYEED